MWDGNADGYARGEGVDERIRQLLPPHYQTIDADVCGSRHAAKSPREAASSVTDLLQRVTEFAESQLNGVPDGIALQTMPLHDIVLTTVPFEATTKFLVD